MNKKIKTTNDEWKKRIYALAFTTLVISLMFVGYIIHVKVKEKQLRREVDDALELAIQIGQNSTVNYIMGNEKYPVRFKKNTIWLNKKELCEDERG